MEPDLREGLLAELRRRLAGLPANDLEMRFPIVFAVGRRSR
jgi:hypothetical protein